MRRPVISAASTAQPPKSAEGKSKVATLGPTSRRTMWGMAKPTKAMGPVAAVALPANTTTLSAAPTRAVVGDPPKAREDSSPIAKRSRGLATIAAHATPITSPMPAIATSSGPRPKVEPIVHRRMLSRTSVEYRPMIIAPDPKAAETPAPTRMSVRGSSNRRDTAKTSSVVIPAPTSARVVRIPVEVAMPMAVPKATKKDAPAVTPINPGSASGFLVHDCASTPATARAAPAK